MTRQVKFNGLRTIFSFHYKKQDLLWQPLVAVLFVATKSTYSAATNEDAAEDKPLVASYVKLPLINRRC